MKLLEYYQLEKAFIERLVLPENEKVNFEPHEHQLWLVIEGCFTLASSGKADKKISRQILLLPAGHGCVLSTYTAVNLFCFRIPSLDKILEEIFPEGLRPDTNSSSGLCISLPLNPLGVEYARHLSVLMESYPFTGTLATQQSYHFLLLIKESYSLETVNSFFSPLYPEYDPFTVFISKYYSQVKHVHVLADLCHLSIRSFERQFKKRFQIPPGKWLLEKRIEKVKREIMDKNVPLTLVADKCRFTTLAQFTDFCKKYLGDTPTKLRKDAIT